MLAPPPMGRTQAGLGGSRTPRQGPGRRPPAPAVPSDWAEQEVRSCLAAPKPSAPRPTSAGPRGQCQARELQNEGQQSGLGPGHARPALLTMGHGSAGAGRGGGWKHQAASHPAFVQGGLLVSVTPPRGACLPDGHFDPTPGPSPILTPDLAQRCRGAPGRAGSWEGLRVTSACDPRAGSKNPTNSSLLGSGTAGLLAPWVTSPPWGSLPHLFTGEAN